MDLSTLRSDLAADLASTGLHVSTTPKHAHAPCVLVGPITEIEVAGQCAWDVELAVWLIAPAPGDAKAVDWLAAHITDVLRVCGDVTATLGSIDVGQGDLPAYEITVNLTGKE